MGVEGFTVAPHSPNTLQPLEIGLCVLEIALPEEETRKREDDEAEGADDDEDHRDETAQPDPYLAGLAVKPLAEAFVAITRGADPATAFTCKTTKKGRLYHVDRKALDREPHPKEPVLLNEGETYDVFWSYSQDLFEEALKDIDARRAATLALGPAANETPIAKVGFFQLTVQRLYVDEEALRELLRGGGDLAERLDPFHVADRFKLAMLMHNQGRAGAGYLDAEDLKNASAKPGKLAWKFPFDGDDDLDAWAFARSPAIAATYFAELVKRYVERVRKLSAWAYARMEDVRAIVEAANAGERVQAMDEPNAENGFGEEYWRWARDCGTAHVPMPYGSNSIRGRYVDPKTFDETLYTMGDPPGDWRQGAREIEKQFGLVHPMLDLSKPSHLMEVQGDDMTLKPLADKAPIIRYFDFYQFGVQQNDGAGPYTYARAGKGWRGQVDDAKAAIAAAAGRIGEAARRGMDLHADCLKAWAEIGWHVRGDAAREEMQARYLDACEDVAFDWWDAVPAEKKKGEAGEELAPPEVSALAKAMQAGFVSLAKQSELLGSFFAWRSRTLAARVTKAWDAYKTMFGKLRNVSRWITMDELTKGPLAEIKQGEITLESVTWTARVEGGAPIATEGWILAKRGKEVVGGFEFSVPEVKGQKYKARIDVVPDEGELVEQAKTDAERAEVEVEKAKARAERADGLAKRFKNDRLAASYAKEANEALDAAKERLESAEEAKEEYEHAHDIAEKLEAEKWGHFPEGFRNLTGGEDVMRLPHWIAGVGYVFVIGMELDGLVREWKEKRYADVALKVTQNVGLLVSSFSEAVEITFKKTAERGVARAMERLADLDEKLANVPRASVEERAALTETREFLEHNGEAAVKNLERVEKLGQWGRVAMKTAVMAEMLLVAREGMATLSEATEASELGHSVRESC